MSYSGAENIVKKLRGKGLREGFVGKLREASGEIMGGISDLFEKIAREEGARATGTALLPEKWFEDMRGLWVREEEDAAMILVGRFSSDGTFKKLDGELGSYVIVENDSPDEKKTRALWSSCKAFNESVRDGLRGVVAVLRKLGGEKVDYMSLHGKVTVSVKFGESTLYAYEDSSGKIIVSESPSEKEVSFRKVPSEAELQKFLKDVTKPQGNGKGRTLLVGVGGYDVGVYNGAKSKLKKCKLLDFDWDWDVINGAISGRELLDKIKGQPWEDEAKEKFKSVGIGPNTPVITGLNDVYEDGYVVWFPGDSKVVSITSDMVENSGGDIYLSDSGAVELAKDPDFEGINALATDQ